MPRAKGKTSAAAKPAVPDKNIEVEKPDYSDEKVDYDEENDSEDIVSFDNNNEEVMDEDVEYEEVEEEEEVEEVEEEIEEEEEEEEEEIEEVEEDEEKVEDEDEMKAHAELLSLPPHGSEAYVGGIPQDTSEEDLRAHFRRIGDVVEVRIMKDKESNGNKGFAFVTFKSVELASRAIDELNGTEFKGRKIKCSTSQAKHRLFIGNVPRSWGEEDLRKVVTNVGPGVVGIELVKDIKIANNNRGFAFIEYHNHACAEYSRRKMMDPTFKLDENAPTVSWADPKNSDSSATSQVKAVYVKNLPKNITQDQVKKLFEHHGKITKVVLPAPKSGLERNRIGFVHFAERSSAMKALKNTEKYELDGQSLECSLAKPQADQRPGMSNTPNVGLLPSYPPHLGYGLVGGGYGAIGAGYAPSGFASPMLYGRGRNPAGMAMMPMLLPDGRIGYVLQQSGGVQPQTPPPHLRNGGWSGGGSGGKSGGSSSRGGGGRHSGNDGGGSGHKYRPY